MRNKHHRTTHKLGKRAFALCLALAVICSCLVPVFATGTGVATMDGGFAIDTGFGVGGDDASFGVDPMDDAYGVDTGVDAGVDTGVDTGTDAGVDTGAGAVVVPPVVDDSSSTSTSGPTITTKETEYGTVTEYDWGDSQTTWTGEDAIATPNDHMKEDDAAFGVLPIEYHFWLKQLDSFDFQMLAHEAEMAEMSETEYLALFGSSEQYPIWHMDTIASTDTISNYKFANPTAKDDPAGENHEFAYWYTVDENGVETEFDPYKTYGSETDTTVNVYAKWKDASGDVAQDTTKTEDTAKTESKTVEVSSKAVISETEDEVTITVKGLPENVKSLNVTAMGEGSMNTFYELYAAQNGTMAPLFGFKIAPKDADGNTVQPKGPVTVTISGLPDDIMISELAPFKVLHQVSATDIETINASYNNDGTLTFATDSFSPFVIASKNGYGATTLNISADKTMVVGETIVLTSSLGGNGTWSSSNTSVAEVDYYVENSNVPYQYKATVYGKRQGTATITYTRRDGSTDSCQVEVKEKVNGSGAWVYLYAKIEGDTKNLTLNGHDWFTIGKVWVPSTNENPLVDAQNANGVVEGKYYNDSVSADVPSTSETKTTGQKYFKTVYDYVTNPSNKDKITLYTPNQSVKFEDITWQTSTGFGLVKGRGADTYVPNDKFYTWHLDGYIEAAKLGQVTINYYIEGTQTKLRDSDIVIGTAGQTVEAKTYYEQYPSLADKNGTVYNYKSCDPDAWTLKADEKGKINLYYSLKTSSLTISKNVTGVLGDTSKDFQFNLFVKTDANTNNATYLRNDGTNGKLSELTNSTSESIDGTHYYKYPFTLKHCESITFEGLPVGSYYVEENDYSTEEYETSYQIDRNTAEDGNRVAIELGDESRTVAFTNHRKLDPDTGVLLDTLPYIVILAVVVGGGILLMLRKRRKNDD